MRKLFLPLFVLFALAACDGRMRRAKDVVATQLDHPKYIEFRRLRAQGDKPIVCGEVDASDMPGAGWRYFVAYLDIGKAAVAPPGGVTSGAEGQSAMLAGAAGQFNHQCD